MLHIKLPAIVFISLLSLYHKKDTENKNDTVWDHLKVKLRNNAQDRYSNAKVGIVRICALYLTVSIRSVIYFH